MIFGNKGKKVVQVAKSASFGFSRDRWLIWNIWSVKWSLKIMKISKNTLDKERFILIGSFVIFEALYKE